MSSDTERASPLITSIDELTALLRAGEKESDALRVGAEHEKLPVFERTLRPVTYEDGIRPLLLGMTRYGWIPEPDAESPISLRRGRASITLEPGGQFELSGAPQETVHEVAREIYEHLFEMLTVSEPLGIRCSTLGLRPRESTSTAPWMPKPRYAAMREFLPSRGRFALDMMLLTATVQANFDFTSEADMVAKMRTAMAISPVVAAIFAHSPYSRGVWTGHRTRRYAVWREVDPARCGLLPFVFDNDFGYRRYVEWALDVPMIFVRREGAYVTGDGTTFRQYWREGFDGARATIADFENHLSTLFPEVRLKRYLEVRSADSCPPAHAVALVALWKGILYDRTACADAFSLTRGLSFAERLGMQIAVAQDGLAAHGAGWQALELARELVRIARQGLARQHRLDGLGRDETAYLDPLDELVATGETLADRLIARYGAGPLDDAVLRQLLAASSCQAAVAQVHRAAGIDRSPVGREPCAP